MPISWNEDEPLIRFWREAETAHLDVREMLAAGGHPYSQIMGCVKQLGSGEALVIHALFEPKPLCAQLDRLRYHWDSRHEGPDHWTLTVRK